MEFNVAHSKSETGEDHTQSTYWDCVLSQQKGHPLYFSQRHGAIAGGTQLAAGELFLLVQVSKEVLSGAGKGSMEPQD